MGDDTSASSGSGSCIRIYGPRNFEDEFHIYKKQDEIRPVLVKIARIQDEVKLDNGLCFGLLDPATNILVNSVISKSEGALPPPPPPPPPRRYAGRRRRRGWTEEEDDGGSWARAYTAQRSFDGLIAFLTCLFPYLPDAEALAYLDAAELDPLVAALIIILRRGVRDDFDLCSPITEAAAEVALRCAAAAAKHPDPRWFVQAWKKVLSPAVEALGGPALPSREALGDAVLRALDAVAPDVLQLKGSCDLAKGRLAAANSKIYASPSKELPPVRAAMKRMLLATIHRFYVQALGRLPTAELCSRYHRSLLIGGYCYGPLDPASNIIVNTIWYEQNFPTGKQFSVSMVSTQMLWRIAARSLYGLISFLCTRHQGLTPDEALRCLLMTGADLRAADSNLSSTLSATGGEVSDSSVVQNSPAAEESARVAGLVEAYTAAATAAFHSYPDSVSPAHPEFLAHQGFIGSASEVLHAHDGGPLSSEDIGLLGRILQSCPVPTSKSHQQHDIAPTKVKNVVYHHMIQSSHRFWGKHERVTTMVRDALDKFNKTVAEGRLFELHIIFGFNEFVSGPVHSDREVGAYNPWTRDKYCHTHINFLAMCKDRPYDSPTIFFAECGKDGADTCWCVPIIPQKPKAEQSRCVYCEHRANRILHPTMEGFYGRDEFDKLFYESDRKFYTNDMAIQHSRVDIDWMHDVEDGAIYLNYYPDGDDGDETDWIQIS